MFGRTVLSNNSILPTRVSADGIPAVKPGGITIDWTTVTALVADANNPDGSVVKSGQKYLRYGQVMAKITASGKFGPHDPAAGDGREVLARGACYILDETVLQYGTGTAQLSPVNDHYGSAVEGGLVFIDRILQSGVGAHSLAAGPTKAELLAAFPNLRLAQD